MSPKTIGVKIGAPLTELPDSNLRNGPAPASHWLQVADACRANPGQWLPVTIGHLKVDRHRGVPSDISHGRLAAFRGGNFAGAFRNNQLYIRFDAVATVAPIVQVVS